MSPYRIARVPTCRHAWEWHVTSWKWDEWVPETVGWSCQRCSEAPGFWRAAWLTFVLGLRNPQWWRSR